MLFHIATDSLILKEIGIASSYVKDITAAFDMDSVDTIQKLANAVKGLNAQQQAYILYANGVSAAQATEVLGINELTDAEIRSAMAIYSAISAKEVMTVAEVKNTIATQTGNVVLAEEVANIVAETVADESGTIAKNAKTAAIIKETMALKGLNAAQIESVASQLELSAGIGALSAGASGLGTVLKGLGSKISAFFSSGIGLFLAGLAGAAAGLVSALQVGYEILNIISKAQGVKPIDQASVKLAKEREEQRKKEVEQIRSTIDREKELANSIENTISEYDRLGVKTHLTAEEQSELSSLQNDLINNFAKEAKGIDLVNGKYEDNIKKLKELNELEKTRLRQKLEIAYYDEVSSPIKDLEGNEINGSYQLFKRKKGYNELYDDKIIDNVFHNTGIKSATFGDETYYYLSGQGSLKETIKGLDNAIAELEKDYTLAERQTGEVGEVYSKLISVRESLVSQQEGITEAANELAQSYIESFEQDGITVENVTEETYQEWHDELIAQFAKDDPTLQQAIEDKLTNLLSPEKLYAGSDFDFSSWFSSSGFDEIEKQIDKLKSAYKSVADGGTVDSEVFEMFPELMKWADNPKKLQLAMQKIANESISPLLKELSELYTAAPRGSEEAVAIKNTMQYLSKISDISSKVTDQYAEQKEILKKQIYDTKQLINRAKEKKEAEQENLEQLKKQKEQLEETLEKYETAASVITDYIDEQIDSLEEQKDAVQETYDKQIQALEDEADERERINDLREKELELEKAKNSMVRVYDSERGGFTIQQNQETVKQAQKEYDNAVKDSRIAELEKERDEALNPFENQITELETYKKSWEDAVKAYQKTQDEMTAAAVFGSDWRNMVIEKDTSAIGAFVQNYGNTAYQLHSIIEPQIEQTEKNIDVIEKEIDSYEGLQNKQKSYLDFFKTYSKDFAIAVGEQKDALVNFANAIKNNATASELFRLYDTVMSKFSSDYIPEFANGGVSNSTGLAMLHGTKQKSEVTFNAEDARKLYEAIHGSSSIQLGNQLAKNLISSALQSTRDSASVVNNNQPTKIENTWVINEPKFSSSEDYRVFANHMDRYVREANMNRLVGKK